MVGRGCPRVPPASGSPVSPVIRMPDTVAMDSFSSPTALDPKEEAEAKKEAANLKYKAQEYTEALAGYTEAIELCPTSPMYYGNRAACYMMLGQYQNALKDARKSLDLDRTCAKAYQRLIKCSIILGDLATARYEMNRLMTVCQDASCFEKEKRQLEFLEKHLKDGEDMHRLGDFRKAVFHFRICCDISTSCTKFKIRKAECWAALGKYEEAKEIANNILHVDLLNVDALYLRGMCLYYQDNLVKSIQLLQEVLRLAPDYSKAIDMYKTAKKLKLKAEEGGNRFKACDYLAAYNLYSEALAIDRKNVATNAKLYYNRGIAASKLKMDDRSLSDWTTAINYNTNYVAKSLLRRGELYMSCKDYEKAAADFERLCKLDNSREHKRKYSEAMRLATMPKSKDYYEVLGVNKTASADDIKKAYKKKAKLHHPDRHAAAADGDKKKEEVIFKEILEAYNVLSDAQKRSRYDRRDNRNDFAQTFGFQYGFNPSASSYKTFGSDQGFSSSYFEY